MSNNRHQISPIPPHPYGERFLNFMSGITLTKEEAERRAQQESQSSEVDAHNALHHHHIPEKPNKEGQVEIPPRSPRNEFEVEKTLEEAQKSTDKQTGEKGRRRSEEEKPDRTLLTHTEPRLSATLPVVQETRETSSQRSSRNGEDSDRVNEKNEDHPQGGSQNHESDHKVEYSVTSDDEGEGKLQDFVVAPLNSKEHCEPEAIDADSKRVSKPPRIGSGIIPTLSPMYRDDEIGIAR